MYRQYYAVVQVCVRFHRQDSTHSLTSRASSRARRDDKRAAGGAAAERHHVTGADDVTKLPFPLEVSSNEQQSDCDPQLKSPAATDNDFCSVTRRAEDSVAHLRLGVGDLEKVMTLRRS